MSDSLDKLREKANRPPDDGRLQALRDALLKRGYSATPRKDERAETDAKELTQYRKDNLTTPERVTATAYNPLRAGFETSLEVIAAPLEAAGQLTTIDSLRSAAGGVRGLAAINEGKMLAPDGSRLVEPGFGTDVAGAFGSAAGFMAGGAAMRGLAGTAGSLGKFAGMGKLAAGADLALGGSMAAQAARLGAITEAQSLFREAETAGASKGQQYAAFFLGLPVGAVEGIGIGATGPTAKLGDIMAKIDKRSGGALGKAILAMPTVIKEGATEAAQEGFQTFSEKMIAQELVKYAEPEDWDTIMGEVRKGALLGGIVGTGLTQLGLTMENRGIKKAKAELIDGAEKDLGRMVLDSAAEVSKGMDPNRDSTGAPRTQASPEDAVARFAESAGIEGGLDFEVVDPEKALDPEAEIPTGEVDLYGKLNNIVGQGGQLPPIVTVNDAKAPPGAYVDGVVVINKKFQNEMLAGIALHEVLHSKARAGSEEFGRLVAEAKEAFPALTLRMASMYEDAFIKSNGQKPFAALPDGPERTALLIEEGFAYATQHMSQLVDEFISNPESIKPGDVAELKTVLQRIAEWLRNALAKIKIGAGGKRSQALAKLDSLLKDQAKRTTQAGAKPEEVVAMAQALARVLREAKIETLPAAPKKGTPQWWESALTFEAMPTKEDQEMADAVDVEAIQAEVDAEANQTPVKEKKAPQKPTPAPKKAVRPDIDEKLTPAQRKRIKQKRNRERKRQGKTESPGPPRTYRRDAGPTAAEAAIEDFERGIDRWATAPLDEFNADKIEELLRNGASVDTKNQVLLFHRTNASAARDIQQTGMMRGDEDGIFFSTEPSGQADSFGDATISLRVPVQLIELDDAFGNEVHVRIPLRRAGASLDVSPWMQTDPDTRFATAPTIEVDGQERPSLNSDGNPIATTDEALRAFYRWFGNSAVVDSEGRPLVVYHGTTYTDIEAFLPNGGGEDSAKALELFRRAVKNNEPFGYMNFRGGTFFSPDPAYAGNYTGEGRGVLYPVYIKAENPIYSDMVTGKVTGTDPNKTPDALILTEGEKINEIAVIEPTQIKSATGNRGTFSPTDPDIRWAAAYHGSPHEFDRFDLSRIGTGEGVQAFGHGLYFASRKEVASYYRDSLAGSLIEMGARDIIARDIDKRIAEEVRGGSEARNEAEADAYEFLRTAGKSIRALQTTAGAMTPEQVVDGLRGLTTDSEGEEIAVEAVASYIDEMGYIPVEAGAGYTVELAPTEDEYLLWDEPLESQSKTVTKALEQTDWFEYAEDQLNSGSDNPTGADLVHWLEMDMDPEEASKTLHDAGIRGTKFLDGSSRSKGTGDYNYVIFNDQDVKIVDRWATAPEEGDIPLVNLGKGALLKGVRARQKWLTSRGLLPQSAFDAMLSRDFKIGELNQQLQFDARDFRKALKEVGGMTRGLEKDLDAALRDERLVGRLPEPLREPVLKMRRAVDALSLALLESGAVEGPVEATIRANMGFYLTRSFQAFDDPDWAKKVPEEVRNRAKAFLRAEFAKIGEPNTDVDAWIDNYLFEAAESKSPIAWLAKGKLGSKDLSILKRRKRIAPEIRALLGEYTDPLVNYARSVSKMTFLIANHQFLSEARAAGLDEGYFSEELKGDTIAKIAADESSVLAPLNGLYTTPDVLEAFTDATSPQVAGQLLQLYMKVNGAVKMGKTVGSAQTHARNVVGNVGFAVAQGHWNLAGTPEALGGFLAGLGISSRADFRKLILEARSYGVTHESARAGELYDILNEALGGDLNDIATSHIKKSLARRTVDGLTALYQAEDDFWKLLAWGIERQRYAKAYPDWTDAQVKERAAKIVRNTFPTYSLVPRGVKAIRYIPLIGAFTSFPAEVVRVGWNTAHLIKSELADPKTRSIGAQRLAGSLAASLSTALAALATAFYFGYDDDDREAMREFVPEWSKSHDFVMLGPDKDGKPRYIDISYTDPWSYLKSPINALLRGDSVSEGVFDALKEVADPFLGEEILAGALMNVRSNQTEAGGSKKVYNDAAPLWTQGGQIAEYLWNKALEPGTVTSVKRIKKGLEGYVSPSGKEYDTEDEVLALVLGQRRSTIDAQQGLIFKARDFSTDTSNANKILSSVASRRGVVDDDEIRDAVVGMEQQRRKIFEDLQKAIKAARQLQVPDPVIADQLEASGVSNYLVRSAIRGVYEPYRVTRSFLQGYESGQSSERIGEIRRRRSLVKNILSELDQ